MLSEVKNESGIKPVEYKVLVRPDKVEEKTKGGIVLPNQTKERDEHAQTKGTLIEVGGNAFEDWRGEKPKSGDRIVFTKYAGVRIEGTDGETYQVIHDKDIAAVLTKEKEEKK